MNLGDFQNIVLDAVGRAEVENPHLFFLADAVGLVLAPGRIDRFQGCGHEILRSGMILHIGLARQMDSQPPRGHGHTAGDFVFENPGRMAQVSGPGDGFTTGMGRPALLQSARLVDPAPPGLVTGRRV